MKRFVALVLAVVFVVSGCGQVVVKAPAGKKIFISSQPLTAAEQEKRVWYILWGLVPLGDNSTASLLANYPDGAEVVVVTEMGFLDYVFSVILGQLSITTRTIKVQQVK
jgi:uncharacterized protein YceK